MLRVLTDKGMKTATVSQLKQNTNFKGWVCSPNQYVIDVEKWTVRQSVCGHPEEQSIDNFEPIEETICPKDNCFCGNDIEMRKGKTKDFLKLLKQAPDKIEPYKGEKLLAIDNENKNYIEFVKWLKGNNPYARVSTSTNGTRSADYLNHLNKYSHLAISIHFEFITDSYVQKLERFLSSRNENKKSVRLKCMLHPKKVRRVKEFVSHFRKYRDIDLTITPLWTPGTKEIMKYEEEIWRLVA